jgi:hypothetical protein
LTEQNAVNYAENARTTQHGTEGKGQGIRETETFCRKFGECHAATCAQNQDEKDFTTS